MVETRRLTQLVDDVVDRVSLPAGELVLALSGGADSAALGYLLGAIGRGARAIHVNHGLPASARMEIAARKVAKQLSIDLSVVSVEVPGGASPEGHARTARYQAFGTSVEDSDPLLTAHTMNDNAETVLMNLVRGSSTRGIAGIPRHREPNIWRPLLDVTGSETREISVLAGIEFVDDPMNQDVSLTRNSVRRRLMPILEEMNPHVVESLHRFSKSMATDQEFFAAVSLEIPLDLHDGSASVPVGSLQSVSPAVSDRVLVSMMRHVGQEPNEDRLERLRSVVFEGSGPQEVGGGVVGVKRGPTLIVEAASKTIRRQSMLLGPGFHRSGSLAFEVEVIDRVCHVAPFNLWGAVFGPETVLEVSEDGGVWANGELAWVPGEKRLPVAWYQPGSVGYLAVSARQENAWT